MGRKKMGQLKAAEPVRLITILSPPDAGKLSLYYNKQLILVYS